MVTYRPTPSSVVTPDVDTDSNPGSNDSGEEIDTVICWDGERLPADQCTLPSGLEGLTQYLVSVKRSNSSCSTVPRQEMPAGEVEAYECSIGTDAGYYVGRFRDNATLAQWLAEQYPGGPVDAFEVQGISEGNTYYFENQGYTVAQHQYLDAPYLITVYGKTLSDRARTERSLVYRHSDQISVSCVCAGE